MRVGNGGAISSSLGPLAEALLSVERVVHRTPIGNASRRCLRLPGIVRSVIEAPAGSTPGPGALETRVGMTTPR